MKSTSSLFRGLLLLLLLMSSVVSAQIQKTYLLVSNSAENPGEIIHLKLITDRAFYSEGIVVYRKEEDMPLWERVTEDPWMKSQYRIPAEAFIEDSTLQGYAEMTDAITPADVDQSLVKAFLLIKSVQSNHFARYLGTQYDDSTAVAGKTYRYMVKRIYNGTEVFEAVSEPITAGPFIPDASPRGIEVEGRNGLSTMTWMIEDKRFHSVNIYRGTDSLGAMEKITDMPLMMSQRKGPDGKMGYPDVFHTDYNLENGTTYYYRLTGIDFFGRETEKSIAVRARPMDMTPPPPPHFLKADVDLTTIRLSWEPADTSIVVAQNVYRGTKYNKPFEKLNDRPLTPNDYAFTDEVPGPGAYYYYVTSVSKNEVEGRSNPTLANVLDVWPPEAPEKVYIKSDSGKMTLWWSGVDAPDLMGYRIYRTIDGDNENQYNLATAYPVADTFWTDYLPFNAKNKFLYRVVAVDSAYNHSDYSMFASARLPDVTPPEAPFIKSVLPIDGGLRVEWLPNFESDLRGFNLFREVVVDSVPVSEKLNKRTLEPGTLSFIDLLALEDVEYTYYLKAVDSTGNISAMSNRYLASYSSPEEEKELEFALKNLQLRYNSDKNEVSIKWNTNDAADLKGVVIFRQEAIDSKLMPHTGLLKDDNFSETLSTPAEGIRYRVCAYSNSGRKWQSDLIPVINGSN